MDRVLELFGTMNYENPVECAVKVTLWLFCIMIIKMITDSFGGRYR